jgi:hypothetical protein
LSPQTSGYVFAEAEAVSENMFCEAVVTLTPSNEAISAAACDPVIDVVRHGFTNSKVAVLDVVYG